MLIIELIIETINSFRQWKMERILRKLPNDKIIEALKNESRWIINNIVNSAYSSIEKNVIRVIEQNRRTLWKDVEITFPYFGDRHINDFYSNSDVVLRIQTDLTKTLLLTDARIQAKLREQEVSDTE